jgi:hypothetical protein
MGNLLISSFDMFVGRDAEAWDGTEMALEGPFLDGAIMVAANEN